MSDRDTLAAEIMDLFHDLSHQVRRRGAERLGGMQVGVPEAIAMHHLDQPLSMGGLAEHLSCDASYVTGLVDRLEQQQLAERRPDPGDRRVRQVVLTERGRRVRGEVEQAMYKRSGLLETLDEGELHELARLLEKILSSVSAS